MDTYLALRCEDGEFLPTILTVLDSRGESCMFFLSPELIESRTDLVIRMLGEGHSVGVLARADSLEETRTLLARGREALADRVFFRAETAMVHPDFQSELEDEGWVCWSDTLELTPRDTDGANYFSRKVLGQLSGRTRTTYLSMAADAHALRILPTLLDRLEEEGFALQLPLEHRI